MRSWLPSRWLDGIAGGTWRNEFDLVGNQEGLIGPMQALERMPGWARVGVAAMTATLGDAVRISETPPYGQEVTFNGFRFDAPAQERIDYIFLSPGWRVLRLGVLTDSLRGRYPSDHFPVVARLQQEGEHAR